MAFRTLLLFLGSAVVVSCAIDSFQEAYRATGRRRRSIDLPIAVLLCCVA